MCDRSFRSIPEQWTGCNTWKQHMVNEEIPVAHCAQIEIRGDLWQWHQNSRSSSFYYKHAFLVVHHLSPKVRFIYHPYFPSMWANLHIWTKALLIHRAICSPGCQVATHLHNILLLHAFRLPQFRWRLLGPAAQNVWTGKLDHSNWSYEPVEGLPEFWSQRALQAFPPSELLQAWLGRMLFPRSPSKLICCTSWGDRILMHLTQLTNSLHDRQ